MPQRFWLATLRGAVQLLLAPDKDAATLAAEPGFEDEQPDELFDVTGLLITKANDLLVLARERVGQGTESHFRYDVDTVFNMWRGDPAPDEWRERYAKEYDRRTEVERRMSGVLAELVTTKDALLAAQADVAPVDRSPTGA